MVKIIAALTFIAITSFLFVLSFNGCNESPVEPVQTVSYSKDIQPIFVSNCSFPGCHNATDKPYGIDLTNWESIMLHGSIFGAEIIPYNAKWSHLIQHINTDTNVGPVAAPLMPKLKRPYTNGEPLSKSTLDIIMKWIDQGAKNDNGEVAFAHINHKAFITNQASDFIAVVNIDNNFVTRYVKVGNTVNTLAAPHNVAVDNQGRYFYVTLISEGYVEKFDAFTYEKVGRVHLVNSPGHVMITPDGTKGYVTNYSLTSAERFIKSFSTATMTEITTINDITMNATHGGRITSDGRFLVTVGELGEFIQVIRTSDDVIENTIPVDPQVPPNGNGTGNFRPIAVSISPDNTLAFITCTRSNDVRVLDLSTREIIRVIPVGLFPIQSECSPNGRWLYVANRNSNSVTVIDVNTLSVFKTINTVGAQPHGVAFTPDGHYGYITCESVSGTFVHHPSIGSSKPGTTAVIDVFNNHVKVKDIEMAAYPAGIAITRQ